MLGNALQVVLTVARLYLGDVTRLVRCQRFPWFRTVLGIRIDSEARGFFHLCYAGCCLELRADF